MEIGINPDIIKKKSNRIREAWNRYFLEWKFCQRLTSCSGEGQTNSTGDLLNYIDGITLHLASFKNGSLYKTIAVLHFMYVQQDLVDELLTIFRLPIRQTNGKKKIRSETEKVRLQYMQSSREKRSEIETHARDWKMIFDMHEEFLCSFLDQIYGRIISFLDLFKLELGKIYLQADSIDFIILMRWVDSVMGNFPKEASHLYSIENMLYCFENSSRHPRYEFAIHSYRKDLKAYICEVISDVNEYYLKHSGVPGYQIFKNADTLESEPGFKESERFMDDALLKLGEKHAILNVEFFMGVFNWHGEIMDELRNMKENIHFDAEYYASLMYLKYLIKGRQRTKIFRLGY